MRFASMLSVALVTSVFLAMPAAASPRGRSEVDAVPWPATADLSSTEPAVVGEDLEPKPAPVAATPAAAPPVAAPAPAPAPVVDDPPWLPPPREHDRLAERPLATGIVFKPGKGLSFDTADKRFSLTINAAFQTLYTATRTRPIPEGADGTTQSLEIRRARLITTGNVFSEHLEYYLQLQFSPRDLGLANGAVRQSPVFMAWTAYNRLRDLSPKIGFFFINYSRQRVQPILRLQAIDFSSASAEFGLERDIGIDLGSKDLGGLGKLRYHIGAFMGEGNDFAQANDFGMLYTGRFEVLPFGDFDDYIDADLARRHKPKLAIGAGYAYSDGDHRNKAIAGAAPTDGGTTDTHNATVDLMFKLRGWSVMGDFWMRQGTRNFGNATVTDDMGVVTPAARERARNGVGWTAQTGFLIPRVPLEIGGRYSGVRGTGTTSIVDHHEAGPMLSYYIAGHSVKLQAQYDHGWGPDRVRIDRARVQLTVGF